MRFQQSGKIFKRITKKSPKEYPEHIKEMKAE